MQAINQGNGRSDGQCKRSIRAMEGAKDATRDESMEGVMDATSDRLKERWMQAMYHRAIEGQMDSASDRSGVKLIRAQWEVGAIK